MRERERDEGRRLDAGLLRYDREVRALLGIKKKANREALVEQLLESVRRVEFIRVIARRPVSDLRIDPADELFDPIRGAVVALRRRQPDEAFWLVFLATHFGRHRRDGWATIRAVYGRLGEGPTSDWQRTHRDPEELADWVDAHREEIPSRFGNHRKYESLSRRGTGHVIETYMQWVGAAGSHQELIDRHARESDGTPEGLFDRLYESMNAVSRFGRTARFDYLTMLGKLGIAAIEPGRTYMVGATGPQRGARLLFGGSINAALGDHDLEDWLRGLGGTLRLGSQVLEDALCNWQKNPDRFVAFRG